MLRCLPGLALLAFLAAAPAAQARTASAATDGRPNILVVMTDDMAAKDLAKMPNVQRLLVRQGTTFTDAVDAYPLCCPARATFITGQYTHNHGVDGNFHPFGWYGMKDRSNTLPSWLQSAGYRTAMIGKWLNGYGSRDQRGEIPKGFDVWRGLLDVSAYDYHNFLMNSDGRIRGWGDTEFAAKLVKFARIQVTRREMPGLGDVLSELEKVMGPRPYTYFGAEDPEDYSVDVTGLMTERIVAAERRRKEPFFVWWSPAASHREDVAGALMGRPGPDPRPPARHADEVAKLKLPRPANFDEADISDKPSNMTEAIPNRLSEAQLRQLELNYQGRVGSLLAVDDHVAKMVATLRRTGQLDNTLIVFLSDNGWMQGEHRVPGDKFLPYEESLKVPFVLRGPGVPKGRTVHGQVANIDFAPTLLDAARAKAGRTMDGVSLLPVARRPASLPDRAVKLEALSRLLTGDFPLPLNGWDRPYEGVRTERFTYVEYEETGDRELYDRKADPAQLRNLAGKPAYAGVQARLAARLVELQRCRGVACTKPARGRAKARRIRIDGRTKNVPQKDGSIRDVGTLTATPFGKGTILLTGRLADGKLTGSFSLRFLKGTIRGTVVAPFTLADGKIHFVGTARLTGGTGAYRRIRSGVLEVRDSNTLDGQNGVLSVGGAATW